MFFDLFLEFARGKTRARADVFPMTGPDAAPVGDGHRLGAGHYDRIAWQQIQSRFVVLSQGQTVQIFVAARLKQKTHRDSDHKNANDRGDKATAYAVELFTL